MVLNKAELAIKLVWLTILIEIIFGGIAILIGQADAKADFVGQLVMCAIFCIIPYKMGNRSNGARLAFLILFVLSILLYPIFWSQLTRLDMISAVIQTAISGYIVWLLVQPEANAWFGRKVI
jgi:hypothetical protein